MRLRSLTPRRIQRSERMCRGPFPESHEVALIISPAWRLRRRKDRGPPGLGRLTGPPYEMLRGTAHFEVDPRDPRDAVIVDLDKAPRDSHGMVEFSTQFLILKPVDPGRGNHKIFYAVNNRGNNLEGLLTATTAAQVAGTDAGYAMTEGYTIVDAGWEGDVIPTSTKLVATLPIAHEANGGPIIGPMR